MDALARVHTWMRLFQTTIDKAATGRFALKAREEAGTQQNLCVGGAILSLDLKQAFDRVNRAALAASLERLGAPQDLIAAVIALHDSSAYHIQDAYHDSEVLTTSSIRQGCKLAPLLWVAISTTVLHQLRDALSGPKRQGTTFADDTLCQWLIETEEDIHSLSKMMAQVLKVMTDLGLHVNLTKTGLLLRVRGPGANRALRQYILRKEGKRHWQVDTEDGPALIPIERSVVYLGTHLELGDCSLANARHRLKEAKGREAKMHRAVRSRRVFGLAHRLRVWRACAVSSATLSGMAPLGIKCPAATLLRSWFCRQLRAVTNSPAHITHESNTALRKNLA